LDERKRTGPPIRLRGMIRSRGVEAVDRELPELGDSPPHNAERTSREAWEQAFRTYHHQIVVSLVAAGVRPDRAVDLAQATWTRLMEQDRAGKLAEIRLPGIALAQARLLALEERRRAGVELRRCESAIENEEETVEAREADPEQQTLDREQVERALAIVAAAAPTAQHVFRLIYGDPPVAYERAAEEVGLSLQRVRQIACELRAKIREALEGERDGGGR
jgi:RNA polymerase sigma factor (sigma-70 family)